MFDKIIFLIRKLIQNIKQLDNLFLVRASGMLDDWYLVKNPDAARARVHPLLHYHRHVGFEGRDPHPEFSSSWYLSTYEDVKSAGINPPVHYLKFGQKEGHSTSLQFRKNKESMTARSFLSAYISEISSNISNDHKDNYDYYRFGSISKEPQKINLKHRILDLLRRKRSGNLDSVLKTFANAIALIEPFLFRFDTLFNQLADYESHNILVKVLAYRALGHQKVKLPLNTPEYWARIKSLEELADYSHSISYPFSRSVWLLPQVDLHSIGYPINLYATPKSIFTQFVLEQYRCTSGQTAIEVEKEDVVIDAGGCWGDTALYFAHRAGANGKVFSYEFIPRNLEIFSRNLNLNQEVKDRIHIVERAVGNKSGLLYYFKDNGPGSSVGIDGTKGQERIETLSIDDLVEMNNLARVDFIKMDIEGSELEALQGATRTIKKYRPKLAISIYHRLVDFLTIPEFILSLDLGYSLYIRHYTIHVEETILFAKAQ